MALLKTMKELEFLLVDEDIPQPKVAKHLSIAQEAIPAYVQQYGIRQCEVCTKRYFVPDDINDTICPRCFQLVMADHNLEFMVDIGAIEPASILEIRKKIRKITSK